MRQQEVLRKGKALRKGEALRVEQVVEADVKAVEAVAAAGVRVFEAEEMHATIAWRLAIALMPPARRRALQEQVMGSAWTRRWWVEWRRAVVKPRE